jgi:hypothetical protein
VRCTSGSRGEVLVDRKPVIREDDNVDNNYNKKGFISYNSLIITIYP